MRKVFMVSIVALVFLLVGCTNTIPEPKTISVVGEAQGEISSDVAFLNVGVTYENKDSEKAKEVADKKIEELYKGLEEVGISKDEVETISYNVNEVRDPNFTYSMDNEEKELPNEILGYNVTSFMKVTINDIDNIQEVVDTVSGKENVIVNGLDFDIKDKSKAKEDIINKAIEDAKKQSKSIASSLGVKVDGVYKVKVRDTNPNFQVMSMEQTRSSSTISPSNVDVTILAEVDFIIK